MAKNHLKYSLILTLIFLCSLKGDLYANDCGQIKSHDKESFTTDFLSDANGIITAIPEVCNGGTFQYNILKLKNKFGGNAFFSFDQNITWSFITDLYILSHKVSKIPYYLFNRRILI
jgi:hypothetical protein